MKILGLSSATKIISVGLIDDGQLLAETTIADLHAEKLLFYVQEAGITPEQIEAIAVAQGPGSYSGLRGGLSTAKTLAQTLNVPLVGVSTLEAIAYNLIDISGTIAVVLDAKSDDFNFALFGADQGKLKRLTADIILPISQIVDKFSKISGEIHLVGNTVLLKEKLISTNYHFAPEIHSHPYGINVARIGLDLIKSGEKADLLTLVPQYSHQPNIREFKHGN
ncbi:tRNA (adenosine(37)-N6)-threonylcarbamoyltransferase complex dimerization subunit type 1 TsaB [Candidatus Saganbacteria bacterium]|nr:tRNA (adenosine(37)-N6)-threonylcarbamoyltransferase complex dimerization subunit type 1 TsaB [Candidatus Saganbacteria bacterium]